MMIEMGLDPTDFEQAYQDPELAALDKKLRLQGKTIIFLVYP